MSNPMEGQRMPHLSDELDEKDLAQIATRNKQNAEAKAARGKILARHSTPAPAKSLEEEFGTAAAARMRFEAQIRAKKDGLKDG